MANKKSSSKKSTKKPADVKVVRYKRKEAIARAYIRKGKGVVRVNKLALSAWDNPYLKAIMMEPFEIVDPKLAGSVDIDVNVYGGGSSGQAQAVRGAIARAFVEYTGDSSLKDKFYEKDKFMIVEDSRRVEPKKYKGRKARARFQKSYR